MTNYKKENDMKSVLMDLYFKHIHLNPTETTAYLQANNSNFQDLLEELNQLEEILYQDLDIEKKRIYDETVYHRVDLEDLKISHSFAEGFVFAMKIALEIATTVTQMEKE